MQKSPQLDAFIRRISGDGLTQNDAAVALVWFATHSQNGPDGLSSKEIAEMMMANRMSGNINVSRLAGNLAKHPQIVRDHRTGIFRIKSSDDAALTARFSDHADLSEAPVSDLFISSSILLGGRRHLDQVRREANGAYERAFYNAAAVMGRRLAEMLLIEALEKAGASDRIRDSSGHLLGFADLISVAQSGQFVRLSRTAPTAIQKIKELGDGAAHHRHFIAAKKDLDALNPAYSMLIAELAAAAGL